MSDWLSTMISSAWDDLGWDDISKGLGAASRLVQSKQKAASAASIIGRGSSVGSPISTSNPSQLKQSTPAKVVGLDVGYDPIYKMDKQRDEWSTMFRRVLSENK